MGFTIIIIYRHVYHSCTVSTSSTFDIPKIWKTWHIRGSKGSGKVGEFEEGRKIKGSLLVIGRGQGGEGRRHRGTERHQNNTHVGQEKSISISLAH